MEPNDDAPATAGHKPKDRWDKAKIVLSVLTPLTLAVLGYYVTDIVETRDRALLNVQSAAERRARLNEGIVGQLDEIGAALYAARENGAYDLAPRIAAITQIAVLSQASDPPPPPYFYSAAIGLLTEYVRQNAPNRRPDPKTLDPYESGPVKGFAGLTADIRGEEPPRYRAVDIVWALRALQEVRLAGERVTGRDLPVPLTRIDFRDLTLAETPGLDLSRFDFSHSDFTAAFLSRCICREASFHHADLTGVTVWNADFRGADFRNARLQDSKWVNVDLRGSVQSSKDRKFAQAVRRFGNDNTGHPVMAPDE